MFMLIQTDFSGSREEQLANLGSVPQFVSESGVPLTSVNHFLRTHCRSWSSNTIRTYGEHISEFLNWLCSIRKRFDECDYNTIHLYSGALCARRRRGRGLSWNTIDRRVRTAASLLQWCARNSYLDLEPSILRENRYRQTARGAFQRVGHPALPIKIPTRWIRLSDALKIVHLLESSSALCGTRNSLIARLMLEAGLRISEVLELSIEQIPEVRHDESFAIVSVLGKGRKHRLVPIPMRLVIDLVGYVENERRSIVERFSSRKILNKSLFLTFSGKTPSRGWIEAVFSRAGKELNLRVTPHMFRHTFGTYHYHLHKDLALLRSVMGHSQMETTELYYVHTAVLEGYSSAYADLLVKMSSDRG